MELFKKATKQYATKMWHKKILQNESKLPFMLRLPLVATVVTVQQKL